MARMLRRTESKGGLVLGSRSFVTAVFLCLSLFAPYTLVAACFDDPADDSSVRDEVEPVSRADACVGVPDEYLSDEAAPAFTIVDTRGDEAYSAEPIPGSLNISLEAISHRSFLADRPLVLIGDDGEYVRLLSFCRQRRRESGKDVFVEPNGIHAAWIGETAASSSVQNAIPLIKPDAFVRDGHVFAWSIVIVSGDADPPVRPDYLPDSISYHTHSPDELTSLADLLPDSAGPSPHRILLVPEGVARNRLWRQIPSSIGEHTRILRGGLEDLANAYALDRQLRAGTTSLSDRNLTCESPDA